MWRRCKRSTSWPASGSATIDDARIARAADDPPYWTEGLTRAATEQRAWVAVDDLGAVIGFAVAWVIDGEGHLDELAVTPAHGRRGVGRALVDEVLAWSAARGLPSVTLITFRDVPWNGPFYEKLGFEAVTALTPALQAALDQGANGGFPAISSCADRSWTLKAWTHNCLLAQETLRALGFFGILASAVRAGSGTGDRCGAVFEPMRMVGASERLRQRGSDRR